jgi:hypothetical protein
MNRISNHFHNTEENGKSATKNIHKTLQPVVKRRVGKLSDSLGLGLELSVLPGSKLHAAGRQLWKQSTSMGSGSELLVCKVICGVGASSLK